MATATSLRWKSSNVPGRTVVTGIPDKPGGFAWIEVLTGNFIMVIEDGSIRRKVRSFDTIEQAYAAAQTWADTL